MLYALLGAAAGYVLGTGVDELTDPGADDPDAEWQRRYRYVGGGVGAVIGALAGGR